MLSELRVRDLGIIEDIEWKLDQGLNVITGETGAGKSLMIDAVELLLTGTAGEEVIRNGAKEARIEGIFIISEDSRFSFLQAFLAEKGLSLDESTLIISCEIRKQKPGVVRINGHTVTKTVLRQTGQLLIDIHGQSEHLSLLNKKYHLDFLDAYGHNLELRKRFSEKVAQLRGIEIELQTLKNGEKENIRQEEFLKFQIDEINRAKLKDGEDEELEEERRIISVSEKLREYSAKVYQALFEGDASNYNSAALVSLNEALKALKKLVELDPKLNQQLDYLYKTTCGVEEVARDVRSYGDNLDHDPKRLEEIESRLELIRNLKRKYGKTISDILAYLEESEKELAGISFSSERTSQLEKERDSLKKEMGKLAAELSIKRAQAAKQLITDVKKELQDLEMSQMRFEISIKSMPSNEGIETSEGQTCAYNNDGTDDVEFMVSTNPGESLKPLAKVASTGEISRFTLALKGALSEADKIPVLIFDEIDIGVGGRSGDIIGKKLWALARNHQVICVTHLPQIAVYADSHFCVHKEVVGQRTYSTLTGLNDSLRVGELAVMLAGPEYSQTAKKNALELMHKAENWKKMKENN